MKKSVTSKVPTPLNILNVPNKTSTATTTTDQTITLGTNDEQNTSTSGTNVQQTSGQQ